MAPRLIVLLLLVFPAHAQFSSKDEDRDKQALRMEWFYSQRLFPNGSIPAGARRNAILQIDRMDAAARAQRQSARAASHGNVPFALTTDAANWTPIGPQPTNPGTANITSGRVNAIAIDPRDTNVVYIGAAEGGVWKTTDGGATWSPLTDAQVSLANGSIALDPQNPDTVYVGTGEENFSQDSYYGAGILKSTDGGVTWTNILGPFVRDFIGAIAVHPTNSQILVCAAQSGVWRSADAGATWQQTLAGVPAISVVFDPTNGDSVYASLGNIRGNARNGVYHSANAGLTWTSLPGTGALSLPTTDVGRVELAMSPSSPATLYAQIQNSNSDTSKFGLLLGIYKTSDAGTTWTRLNTTLLATAWGNQMWYDNRLRVSPKDPNVVWSGGVQIFRSLDGGSSWSLLASAGSNGSSIHVDYHYLEFTPDGNKLYIANDGGMYSTTDITANRPNWTNLNATLAITQFYPGFSMDTLTSGISVGGTQDNSTQWFDGTGRWSTTTCGDGGFTALDPSAPGIAYSACQQVSVRQTQSFGANASWFEADYGISQSDAAQFIAPLVMDPSNPQALYFGTFRVWQSSDGGGLWAAMSADLTGGNKGTIKTIAVAPSDSNFVYAGTSNGKLQVTSEALRGAAAAWVDRSAGLPVRAVTKIAVDPLDPPTAYATYSGFPAASDLPGHIYKTTNAGAAWSDITGNLPSIPVNDLVVDPDLPNTLYIGTDSGVMLSTNGGASWSTLGNGLPKVVVSALALQRRARVLRAATHGRSVWELAIPLGAASLQPSVDTISPSTVETGSGDFVLAVAGSGFVPGTVIRWNGQSRKTTFTDPGHVAAQITAADVVTPGRAAVSAFNASSGGGASNPKNFNIGSGPKSSPAAFVSAANPTGGSQLAPRSIASLYGVNLAQAVEIAGAPPLPVTLGGTSLSMSGSILPLFFVAPGQINFQVPLINVTAPTTVTLIVSQGLQTTSVPVVLKPYAPSLFTTNGQGSGQAYTVIAGTSTLAAPVGSIGDSRPARPAEFVSIFCTGLGAVSNTPSLGAASPASPLAQTTTTPQVSIGNLPAVVQFSGLAPGFVGLYQVNAQVPNGITPGGQVPVVLTIGGVTSNTVTIAVAAQ